MAGIESDLKKIMASAFEAVTGDATVDPQVHSSQHAHYQADAALGLAKRLKRNPREIAEQVIAAIDTNIDSEGLIESAQLAGPGFINITVCAEALARRLQLLAPDSRCGVPQSQQQTIVVDYSAPNVAKEMHVGHLRSTIIGDACVRLMQWLGHRVIRRNHIGDWGTPFGMLIEHLLDMGETQAAEELSVGDLNGFYKAARVKFNDSDAFQKRARERVVLLQSGDEETLRLWKVLINQSQNYFMGVYNALDVCLTASDFYGESAYNDQLLPTLNELRDKGLVQDSDGAECLFPPGFKNRDGKPLPLIVRKSDGGFGYAATDLAAIRERNVDLDADRILYVVGAPQRQHLEMIFAAAKMANWRERPASAEHISFGSVLGSDGKMFASRAGETIKLAALLDEAVARAQATVDEKNPSLDAQERSQIALSVGIGAIKYADLSSERTRDYEFNFDRMLSFEGNTAPYLQYAHARIHSILRQAESDDPAQAGDCVLEHVAERALALLTLRFSDVVDEVAASLMFHKLTGYLFDLATAYSTFYAHCPVLAAETAQSRQTRLLLCQTTAQILSTGLDLLGIKAPKRM